MVYIKIWAFHFILINIIFHYNFSNTLGKIINHETHKNNRNKDYDDLSSIREKSEPLADITDFPERRNTEEFPEESDIHQEYSGPKLHENYESKKYKKRLVGIKNPSYRWPNKTVIWDTAPHTDHNFYDRELKNVTDAMKIIEAISCIKFKRRQNEEGYIELDFHTHDCKVYGIGYLGNVTRVALAPNRRCMKIYVLIHLFLHVLGVLHEHQRDDRDKYVTIRWWNVRKEFTDKYVKLFPNETDYFNTTYDVNSIMHYSFHYAVDPKWETLLSIIQGKTVEPNFSLSPYDIHGLRIMYNCTEPQYCPPCDSECYIEPEEETKKHEYHTKEVGIIKHMLYHAEQNMKDDTYE